MEYKKFTTARSKLPAAFSLHDLILNNLSLSLMCSSVRNFAKRVNCRLLQNGFVSLPLRIPTSPFEALGSSLELEFGYSEQDLDPLVVMCAYSAALESRV